MGGTNTMAKQTITQRSFLIGEPREEFLEADDLDLRLASLRKAQNVRIKATRTIDQKLGSWFRRPLFYDVLQFEIRPTSSEVYVVDIGANAIQVTTESGGSPFGNYVTSFGDKDKIWVENFGSDTIIGCENGLFILKYIDPATWTLNPFSFAAAPGGELAQPYWSYVQGITMTPSALTGVITLTASAAFFTPAYVGQRIRYNYREVLITAFTSSTVVTGTVVSRLPPTYRLTLTSAASFQVGDAVVGQDTDFQGLIVAISGSQIDVVTLRFLDGPDVGEKISAPSATSEVTAKATITPAASTVWDEPLISPIRGYPQSAAGANGRLIMVDFPSAPDVICASSVREIADFLVGTDDDDAIVRAVGDNSPRFLHAVNAGDLILLSDRGIYVVELQGSAPLTPSTFVPRLVDRRGSSSVKPASVDDGVIFVDASGTSLVVVRLDGNIYKKWSARTISTYHAHLIRFPVALCGPPQNGTLPEKYLFVVNADGTLAVMSWVDSFDAENVGFVEWTTQGSYKTVSAAFGGYRAVVERDFAAGTAMVVEEFAADAYVDCAIPLDASINSAFYGQELHVCGHGWYAGTGTVEDPGIFVRPGPVFALPLDAQAGFLYTSTAGLWPQEQVSHPKAGILAARVIRVGVSVLHTGPFAIRCNNITQRFGGYAFGENLSVPSVPKTRIYRCSVTGRRFHPEIKFIKEKPGLFQILAATQEVTF
jgi:hypothetical protein